MVLNFLVFSIKIFSKQFGEIGRSYIVFTFTYWFHNRKSKEDKTRVFLKGKCPREHFKVSILQYHYYGVFKKPWICGKILGKEGFQRAIMLYGYFSKAWICQKGFQNHLKGSKFGGGRINIFQKLSKFTIKYFSRKRKKRTNYLVIFSIIKDWKVNMI